VNTVLSPLSLAGRREEARRKESESNSPFVFC
jgi:hypothetical protein